MSLNKQIENEIHSVIDPMISHGDAIINPNKIADIVQVRIDPDDEAPELISYTSTLYLRGIVRKLLARNFDPVEKAKQKVESGQSDIFDGVLQDYYPVKRTSGKESELLYAQRYSLNQDDVDRICHRMEQTGASLFDHSSALRSFIKEKAA